MTSYREDFNLEVVQSVLENIASFLHLKLIASAVVLAFHWVLGPHQEATLSVVILISLDTLTGVAKHIRSKTVSSRGFFRFAAKLTVYLILMATASLVDKVVPIAFALPVMVTFLSVTEGISVMENVGAMGFSVPSHLLKLLRKIRDVNPKEGKENE